MSGGSWSDGDGRGPEHQGRGAPTLAQDFRGATDSIIEEHPSLSLDPGRESRWWIWALLFSAIVGGGGGAAWFYRAELNAWFQSAGEDEEPASEETEAGEDEESDTSESDTGDPDLPGPADLPPHQPAKWPGAGVAPGDALGGGAETTGGAPSVPPGGTTGSTGTPDAGDGTTTGGDDPKPTDAPTTDAPTLTFSVSSRGVRASGVRSRLASAEGKAAACITAAATRGVAVQGEVTIRFGIKWNGSPQSIRVRSVPDDAELSKCLRRSVPGSRFPAPGAGKDGSATWTIQVK